MAKESRTGNEVLERGALNILVDHSSKPSDAYGSACYAWAAWNGGWTLQAPISAGTGYFRINGPNKTFCEGIIAALMQCRTVCTSENIVV